VRDATGGKTKIETAAHARDGLGVGRRRLVLKFKVKDNFATSPNLLGAQEVWMV